VFVTVRNIIVARILQRLQKVATVVGVQIPRTAGEEPADAVGHALPALHASPFGV